jgi:hypothetical protein
MTGTNAKIKHLSWSEPRLAIDLQEIVQWSKYFALPVPYSINDSTVWATTSKGWNAPGEREDRTGENDLLDKITKFARRSRPEGGRFHVMGDGAYWVESGEQFMSWTYVDPDDY